MSPLSVRNGPLGDRRFRLLFAGRTLSFLGSAVFPVALTMAVVAETGSAASLGLVLAVAAGAELLFMIVGGVWADRLPRQYVMLVADAVRCVVHTFIGLQMINGVISTQSLLIAALFTGTASAFFTPASFGLTPATVEPHLLQRANALMGVGWRTAMLAGPAVATGLTLTVGAGWAILLDGFTFGVSVLTLALLRVPGVVRERTTFFADIRSGWHEVSMRRWFWTNVTVHGLWNFARCFYFTVGAAVVITSAAGEVGWGVLAQAGTVGAFLGAVISLRIRPRRPLILTNVCLAVGALPLVAIALGWPTPVIAVTAVMMNTVLGILGTIWNTTIQQQFPEESISKVGSYDWVGSIGLNPLGMAIAAPVALAIGARTTLIAAAVFMFAPALLVLLLPDVRRLEPEPDAEPVTGSTGDVPGVPGDDREASPDAEPAVSKP